MQKKIRVFEAFSGYGSQSIALRNLGLPYEVVAISEIDKYAIQAYKAIHGEVNNLGDISKINSKDIPQHDLFTYSFPCQDISLAGKQASFEEGSGTRSSLLWECKKIIESCRPKYLLMENVKNLISKKHKPNFDKWLLYLESLGYTNYWQILNSKDYGIPQSRERVFVISILDEHKPYKFPKAFKLDKTIEDILEDSVPGKYFINDKRAKKMLETKIEFEIISKSNKIIQLTYPSYSQQRIYSPLGISPTISAGNNGGGKEPCKILLENKKVRKLTPKEVFRLMGMNDIDIYKIQNTSISDTQQYKMAGNSIVIQVLENIFKNLFMH